MSSFRNKSALNKFLGSAKEKGDNSDFWSSRRSNGTERIWIKDGDWRMLQVTNSNDDYTLIGGHSIVKQKKDVVWNVSFQYEIAEPDLVGPVEEFAVGSLHKHLDPNFSAAATDGVKNGKFEYKIKSLRPGELTVAMFAINETILDLANEGRVALEGYAIGGWVD
jgi:hypothetical protein